MARKRKLDAMELLDYIIQQPRALARREIAAHFRVSVATVAATIDTLLNTQPDPFVTKVWRQARSLSVTEAGHRAHQHWQQKRSGTSEREEGS